MSAAGANARLLAAAAMLAAAVAIAQDEAAPSTAEAMMDKGVAAFSESRHAEAARLFAGAAALHPQGGKEASARLMQAKALAAMARFEDAIVVLDACLELSPSAREAYEALMLRGKSLIAASATTPHFHEAAVSFSMAMETDGISRQSRTDAALHLIDALLRMGDRANATKTARRLGDQSALRERAAELGLLRLAKARL